MLNLKNITKEYKTKTQTKVKALNNINLSFPNKGLCLIFGKSGSGKTTLLNIIGGLDTKFDGELSICNKQITTTKDYDNYRKNYVSYVFQDFNLINDLSIEENLLLGYRFSTTNPTEQISDVLNKVGLKGYEKRYPKELSGGEQQRIAIARALLKNSKILLADEPTGNLDKENGEIIYDLLQEIAKDKLVIIVSHDLDLGYKYAQYIIELKNGEIIQNNMNSEYPNSLVYETTKCKVIPNKMALKFAIHELGYKKIKSILTILLMVVCFAMLAFTISIFQYNHSDPHYHLIKSQGYEYFEVSGVDYDLYKKLKEQNINCFLGSGALYFNSKQEVIESGLKLYESDKTLELGPNIYYISDAKLKEYFNQNEEAIIDNEKVYLNYEEYSLEDFIGGKLLGSNETCGGIYYSSYDATNQFYQKNMEYDELKHYTNHLYETNIVHISKLTVDNPIEDLSINASINKKTVFLKRDLKMENTDQSIVIDTNGNIQSYNDAIENNGLADNEAYISLTLYNEFFRTSYKVQDIIEIKPKDETGIEVDYICKIPLAKLDNIFSLNIVHDGKNYSLENLKIKGLIIKKSDISDKTANQQYVCLNSNSAFKYTAMIRRFKLWIKTSDIEDLKEFLNNLKSKVEFETPITKYLVSFEETVDTLQQAMIFTSIALVIIVVIMISLLLSTQVLNRKNEIGIFKALGARNRDITKIYLYEILVITIPIIVFSILSSFLIINLMNKGFIVGTHDEFVYIYYKLSNIPYTIIAIICCTTLSIIIPLIKVSKTNVIDTIRSIN